MSDLELSIDYAPSQKDLAYDYRVSDLTLLGLPPMRIVELWTEGDIQDLRIFVLPQANVAIPKSGLGVLFRPRTPAECPVPVMSEMACISGIPHGVEPYQTQRLADLTDWEVFHLKGKGLGRHIALLGTRLMHDRSRCRGLHITLVKGFTADPYTEAQHALNRSILALLKQMADSVQARLWVKIPARQAEIIWHESVIAQKIIEHQNDGWVAH